MNNENWNIYQMNDQDAVAAEDYESAKKWYLEETGLSEEDGIDEALANDTIDVETTIWVEAEDVLTEEEKKRGVPTQVIHDTEMVKVSFKRILKASNAPHPFIIASTEY